MGYIIVKTMAKRVPVWLTYDKILLGFTFDQLNTVLYKFSILGLGTSLREYGEDSCEEKRDTDASH